MILQILIGLVGLGIVVFVHEAGHLIVAKLVGIEVEAFSIGWGKRLAGFNFRGTDYRISLIPIGGYCKMKGEGALQQAIEEDEDVIRQDKGAFYTARPWQRILVLLAGPGMNAIFAVLVLAIISFVGYTYQTPGNRIVLESQYPQVGSSGVYPATEAGLRTGDAILSIGNTRISNFRDLEQAVTPNPGVPLAFRVRDANGKIRTLTVTPALNKNSGAGRIGVYPWIDPVVASVTGPGNKAGLRAGDRIIAVDGTPVPQTKEFEKMVVQAAGTDLSLSVQRNGTRSTVTVAVPKDTRSATSDLGIQFALLDVHTPHLNPAQALLKGADETVRTVVLTVKGIGLLFRGVNVNDAVAGPVRITYMVGEAATQGFALGFSAGLLSVFNFLSLLSVVLGFMNLLPIPLLDGGQILLSAVEGVTRRPLRPRHVHRYQLIGVVIVVLLIFFAFFNDIIYFVRQ